MGEFPHHDGSIIGNRRKESGAFRPSRLWWRPLDPCNVICMALQSESRSPIVRAEDEDVVIVAARGEDVVVEPINVVHLFRVRLEAKLLRRLQVKVEDEETDGEIILCRKKGVARWIELEGIDGSSSIRQYALKLPRRSEQSTDTIRRCDVSMSS